jgi:hypothetical protein
VETLDELLRRQRAAIKEGFDADNDYWLQFMPTLTTAYVKAGGRSEGRVVIQGMMRWNDFWESKKGVGVIRSK